MAGEVGVAKEIREEQAHARSTAAVAKIKGEPLASLPHDLYIPPDALEVILESFEGPLDLLLYLIRRQNLDILDIPIAEITRQYMRYVELMKDLCLDLAAEYLAMAAVLAHIKSRMLLPQPTQEAPDETDPRIELARRLQEYEQFKEAAGALDELPRLARDIFPGRVPAPVRRIERSEPVVSLRELIMALADVMARAEHFAQYAVQREALSVRQRMVDILSRVGCECFCALADLVPAGEGRLGVTVTFLAVLELFRERLIELRQTEAFAPIYVRAAAAVRNSATPGNEQGMNNP
ncbi:MAG: segregation/condensation protein A [Nitrococcus sp.]|nr:segregation/condensation protein A [Nitrococcus sp.]